MNNTHALDLESGSSQYAYCNDSAVLDISGSITIELWVKPETVTGDRHIITKGRPNSGNAGTNYSFRLSGGALQFYYNNGINGYQIYTSTPTLSVSQAYHIALTYTFGTASSMKMYINGIPVSGSWTFGTGAVSTTTNNNKLAIGAVDIDGTPIEFADGTMNNLRLWNVSRTAQQIRANIFADVTGQSGLVGWWKFNGDYTDSSGNGNTLTAVNSPVFTTDVAFPEYKELNPVELSTTPLSVDGNLISYYPLNGNSNDAKGSNNGVDSNITYTTGKFSNAASFNGTNSRIVPSTQTGIPSGSSPYTFSAWVNVASFASPRTIVGLGNTGTNNHLNVLKIQSSTQVQNYWWGNDLSANTGTLPTSEWMHVVATFDGTTRRIYLNAIIIAQDTPVGKNTQATNFKIGEFQSEWFSGLIEDLAIFNRALTANEVFDLYTGPQTSIKKISGIVYSSIKKVSGVAIGSVKKISGVQ